MNLNLTFISFFIHCIVFLSVRPVCTSTIPQSSLLTLFLLILTFSVILHLKSSPVVLAVIFGKEISRAFMPAVSKEHISACRYPRMPTEAINIFFLSDILGLSLFPSVLASKKRDSIISYVKSIILLQNKFRKWCTFRNTVISKICSTPFMSHATFYV